MFLTHFQNFTVRLFLAKNDRVEKKSDRAQPYLRVYGNWESGFSKFLVNFLTYNFK